jgi:capsular exopolysaccharide synthesis family protein
MSRIEEALKRAAGTPVSSNVPTARDRFSVAGKSRARVEDYTEEQDATVASARVFEREVKIEVPALPRPKTAATATPSPPLSHVSVSAEGKLVSLKGISPASVEQYRRLATALHGLQQQHGIKSLMVTSSVPSEGKTLTSTNLALTFSESYGRRVLLIDCDLRRPFVHELFGIANTAGLGDGLRSPDSVLPLLEITPKLTVLPAGRPDSDPMAGLASERMRDLVKEACERFDWVILDTPPVGMISDANLVAALVDGVVLVISAGTTSYQLVERTINEIGRDRIIGTVLNRADKEATPTQDYYQHYYYGNEHTSGRS